ncbi:MAG: glycine betaine/L-proline ABC transporter ATP-binding protein ProV [Gammaproteobacteria bacterium]|nr:glycine betaine/L-proline ABC transporter ATP-binding protein ProV [Gammaproteobacteria bacterium]
MTDKIVIEDVYKIFGPRPQVARDLIDQGYDKDRIFAETGNTVGVQQASFSIKEGEVFVVMGLSGSGKSTMVRMLNRLIDPSWGSVRVLGQDITTMSRSELIELRRTKMSMVFQSFALMPHQTVLENAAFGLEVSGSDRRERERRAMRALEQVGLDANANSYPSELSGGMKQRVGLARALAVDPEILLMDEAFSALDPLIRTQMQDELIELQRQERRTIVFISHDLDEAMRIGDRIAIMEQGKVVQIGTPEEIVTNPADEYVRSFFHGVDVTKVFTGADLAGFDTVSLIRGDGGGADRAREQIQKEGFPCGVVVDADDLYQGVVTPASLDGADNLRAAFVGAIEPARADETLNDVLHRVAHLDVPVPVVDDGGRFLGSVSRRALLQTLDRTR